MTGDAAVNITHPDKGRNIVSETWTQDLASAIVLMFNCRLYSQVYTPPKRLKWVFYGIAENASAAALAFEMVHNIIQDWSLKLGKGNKNSYRLGVAYGLYKLAVKEEQDLKLKAQQEEVQAKKAFQRREREENEARQREIDRLQILEDAENEAPARKSKTAKVEEDAGMPDQATRSSNRLPRLEECSFFKGSSYSSDDTDDDQDDRESDDGSWVSFQMLSTTKKRLSLRLLTPMRNLWISMLISKTSLSDICHQQRHILTKAELTIHIFGAMNISVCRTKNRESCQAKLAL